MTHAADLSGGAASEGWGHSVAQDVTNEGSRGATPEGSQETTPESRGGGAMVGGLWLVES